MSYREDADLEFLSNISSNDLHDLVECLIKDNDGSPRYTERLTGSNAYKANAPYHARYWQLIAAEIQCFGANSITTVLRGGKGIPYREVLTDVSENLGIKDISATDTTMQIEEKLLTKLLVDAFGRMSTAEREELASAVGTAGLVALTPAALTAAIQLVFKMGGFKSFQLTIVVANAVSRAVLGRGLALAGNAALTKAASLLTGPVGWAITGAWTLSDIAGPAYRVTVPAAVQVALLRKKYQAEREGLLDEIDFGLKGS